MSKKDEHMSQQEIWYWNDKRIQAAIAAMQTVDDHVSTVEELAKRCVRYADALISELKKGGNHE